jgi:hypothetical protein
LSVFELKDHSTPGHNVGEIGCGQIAGVDGDVGAVKAGKAKLTLIER